MTLRHMRFLSTPARPALYCLLRNSPRARLSVAATVLHAARPLPARPSIDESDITESFLKGSGPGGQKINKTSSAVQLRHTPTGIVIKFQGTRSRAQNRKIARAMLAERLEEMEKGSESRSQIKRAIQSQRKASKAKKSRRKYRALEQGKKADTVGEKTDGDCAISV